ncbi:MAG TPA: [acyl-carrier-protein] S-malonyltransferase [Firmicutes bacterium]|nr:[acyl-carrier-protein] S-malonyltransferase [Bacillota bacterium]
MKKFACIFPGQGSQAVGMASPFLTDPLSSEIYFRACETIDLDMMKLISRGPEEQLTLTANAQPAILTTSIAAWVHIEKAFGDEFKPSFMAGHSLGEFSALAASGAIGLEDAVKLVRKRGELMQSAVPEGVGAMAALMGGSDDDLAKIIQSASGDDILDIANLNAPGQNVISGHAAAVNRAVEMSRDFNFKRAVMLQVSAPFHSRLMALVRAAFGEELRKYSFQNPKFPVVHNVNAEANDDSAIIGELLAKQIDSPVRWVESVQLMINEGVEVFIEVGHGNVLQGLVKKIAGRDWNGSILGVASPGDVSAVIDALK